VHEGFYSAYNDVRQEMGNTLIELMDEHEGYPILVTGHSLGGALAIIAAVDIME
jgi:alpha-beta hydrolase superfamily lysophospholipase